MRNCWVQTVPPVGRYKAFEKPVQDWRERLMARAQTPPRWLPAALLGSKMPVHEASALIQRLTGVDLLPRHVGSRSQKTRAASQGNSAANLMNKCARRLEFRRPGQGATTEPFTLVIENGA